MHKSPMSSGVEKLMTVSKNPKYKADKRIQREWERYISEEISVQEYRRRIANIQEYYEIEE